MAALGDRFRAAREARGLTLSEVAEQIRIRSVYLSAIEDENWAAIGAPVYVRGFLRTYARFLGLDPEESVAEFRGSVAPSIAAVAADPSLAPTLARPASRNLSPVIWIASLVAVLLIGFVVYLVLSPQRPPEVAAVATKAPLASATLLVSTTPLASLTPLSSASSLASPAASPGDAGPGSLQVVVGAPSWLRVSVDGSVSMVGTFPAGTDRVFRGKNIQIRVGNAGGVMIYVDGKSLGKLGKSGDVVDRTFTL